MHKAMDKADFIDEFQRFRRHWYSKEALSALYDWHTAEEALSGRSIEFDPIEISQAWGEYRDERQAALRLLGERIEDRETAVEALYLDAEVIELSRGWLVRRFLSDVDPDRGSE